MLDSWGNRHHSMSILESEIYFLSWRESEVLGHWLLSRKKSGLDLRIRSGAPELSVSIGDRKSAVVVMVMFSDYNLAFLRHDVVINIFYGGISARRQFPIKMARALWLAA